MHCTHILVEPAVNEQGSGNSNVTAGWGGIHGMATLKKEDCVKNSKYT